MHPKKVTNIASAKLKLLLDKKAIRKVLCESNIQKKERLMRHPLWILNSSLLLICIIGLIFIFLSREKLPIRESIEPEEYRKPIKREISKINISKIYEYDLFDTYKKELPVPPKREMPLPFPEPPTPQVIKIPEQPKPSFLDPLDITLKGIIIVAQDDTKDSVIIEDNKTKQESVYKVGDKIEDAQLIRIFNNKVIFVRSNGQQEVLYLRQKDAEIDPAYAIIDGWESVIQKEPGNNYLLNPQEFTKRIKNLAQFIDILNLTTVYKQGKSVGCRIGHLEENSLGLALGLQSGDIIVRINDIPATDTAHRFEIYKHIIALDIDDTITVALQRNNEEVILTFTLQCFRCPGTTSSESEKSASQKTKEDSKEQTESITNPLQQETEKQRSIMKEKHKLTPTVQKIRMKEKENMLKKGKKR